MRVSCTSRAGNNVTITSRRRIC